MLVINNKTSYRPRKNVISVFIFDYFDLLEICMRLNLNVNIGIKFVVIQVTL